MAFSTFKPCIRFKASWINYVRYVMLVTDQLLKCIFVTCDRPIFLVKWKIGIFSFWIDIHTSREASFCKTIFLETRSKYRLISRVLWFSICLLFFVKWESYFLLNVIETSPLPLPPSTDCLRKRRAIIAAFESLNPNWDCMYEDKLL